MSLYYLFQTAATTFPLNFHIQFSTFLKLIKYDSSLSMFYRFTNRGRRHFYVLLYISFTHTVFTCSSFILSFNLFSFNIRHSQGQSRLTCPLLLCASRKCNPPTGPAIRGRIICELLICHDAF